MNFAAGQALHVGHPRSFNTIQSVNSVLLSAARVPGPMVGLQNQLGFSHRFSSLRFIKTLCHSMKSGNQILDNLLESVKDPVFREKEEIERALRAGKRPTGALGRSGPRGFVLESDNVSLEVRDLLMLVTV